MSSVGSTTVAHNINDHAKMKRPLLCSKG